MHEADRCLPFDRETRVNTVIMPEGGNLNSRFPTLMVLQQAQRFEKALKILEKPKTGAKCMERACGKMLILAGQIARGNNGIASATRSPTASPD